MGRDKTKDDKYFNCSQEHELDYVSGLYADKNGVYDHLKKKCKSGEINYCTHKQVYKMIQDDLGYPAPN